MADIAQGGTVGRGAFAHAGRAWLAKRGSTMLIGLIALSLPALAVLQYRWTGELSDLEQLRARTNLEIISQRLSTEFDATLAAVYAEYAGPSALPRVAGEHSSAAPPTASVPYRRLVKHAYLVSRTPKGDFTIQGTDGTGVEKSAPDWPQWLRLPNSGDDGVANAMSPAGLGRTLLDDPPAMTVGRSANEWSVVVLDIDAALRDVVPAILAGCLTGGIPVSYDVLIHADDDASRVLYRSTAGLSVRDFDSWITHVPMFAVHGRDLPAGMARGLHADAGVHRWRLYMKPRDGALEAAVASARARNLGIGAGVLTLLALSVGLLVLSMRRTNRATRDQLEAVARMSHELRTPLAVIASAGENLADNVVGTAAEAQQYGEMIQREGQRLNKTVADILLCCRLQSAPRASLAHQPTDVAEVIDRALADVKTMTSHDRVCIEAAVDPALPLVPGDAEALRVAVKNLLVNAVRHGNHAPVRLAARYRAGQGAVIVEITDHGPGIPADELPNVFDAFFRGRRAREAQIEGSGIGLSVVYHVVRSHGGRVQVSPVQPHGTHVVVQLPALKPHAATTGNPAA